jgi:lipoprotein-releasing system permease protein
MFYELWIALRFIKARRRERIISVIALISVLGIAVGVAVLIVVISVMSGFDRYLEDKMIGTHAHIVVESLTPSASLEDLMKKIKDIPGVIDTAPFASGGALIKEGSSLINVQLRGIVPGLEPKVTKIKEYIKQGDLNLGEGEIIIGEELANRLYLKVGDSIALISPETIELSRFKIKGVFNSGMYIYDSGLVISNLKTAQDFFGLSSARNGISVKADNVYQVEEIKERISRALAPQDLFEIRTWMDLNRNFLEALKLEKLVMFIVVIMTTVVAAFGIVNTLIMSVMEKTKDIGILRAVGARVSGVLQIFLFQGLGLGCMGILLGVIGGVSLAASLNNIINFISRLIGRSLIPKDIYYFDHLPIYFNVKDISIIAVCAFIITLLASIYPAYHASRLKPTEALRYE